ncbi:MAG: molybdate ABC transporter permease subunit [Flavobacteriales bacterium]|nr:molybdate ABC transporter permease subunit [Flavobacteriales bacterium]
MEFTPFYLTFKLAIWTTVLLFIVVVPLAYLLAYSKWKIKIVFESVFMLPIILPPTVLGYYYLTFMGPSSNVGSFFQDTLGLDLTFTFNGILIGSMIYCLPFMLNPLVAGFRSVPKQFIDSAKIMGKSRLSILWNVQLPQIKNFIWNALLLTFAHTIGEFGVVLMIGGNLPETKVASIAIYDEMNQLNFDNANTYAVILLGISFAIILLLTIVMRKNRSTFA